MNGEGGEIPSSGERKTTLPSAKDAELQRARKIFTSGERLKPINLQQFIAADIDTTLDDKESIPKEEFKKRMSRLKDLREYALNIIVDEPLISEEKQRQRAELVNYLEEKEQRERGNDEPLATQNADVFQALQQVVNNADNKEPFSDEELKAFLQQAEEQLTEEDEAAKNQILPGKLLVELHESAEPFESPSMNAALKELTELKERGEITTITLSHLLPVMDAEALDMVHAQEKREQSEIWKALDAITQKAQQELVKIPAGESVYVDIRSLKVSRTPPDVPHMPFNNNSLSQLMFVLHPLRHLLKKHDLERTGIKKAAKIQEKRAQGDDSNKGLKEKYSEAALSYLRPHRTGPYKNIFEDFFTQVRVLQD